MKTYLKIKIDCTIKSYTSGTIRKISAVIICTHKQPRLVTTTSALTLALGSEGSHVCLVKDEQNSMR